MVYFFLSSSVGLDIRVGKKCAQKRYRADRKSEHFMLSHFVFKSNGNIRISRFWPGIIFRLLFIYDLLLPVETHSLVKW